MSNGIMEKNLPVADSITGDEMVRIVTGGGNSKNADLADIRGYECSTEENEVFSGSVASTTSYNGAYVSDVVIAHDALTSDKIKVVFNGTEYEVDRETFYSFIYYGGTFNGGFSPSSFETYPFSIFSDGTGYKVAVQQSGTNTVIVSTISENIVVSPCLEKVIDSVVPKNIVDYGSTGIVENSIESNVASGDYSHAEGSHTTASGTNSHAEGTHTNASGDCSHAEGSDTTASGDNSHTEGLHTTASGTNSHAEGSHTTANGIHSHAEGYGTIASHRSQHVFGEYNAQDPSSSDENNRGNYVEIVGNGTFGVPPTRSNARTLDWSGNEKLAGGLTLGLGTSDETTITASQLKALLALLNNA